MCVADRNLDGAKKTADKIGKGAFAVEVSVTEDEDTLATKLSGQTIRFLTAMLHSHNIHIPYAIK